MKKFKQFKSNLSDVINQLHSTKGNTPLHKAIEVKRQQAAKKAAAKEEHFYTMKTSFGKGSKRNITEGITTIKKLTPEEDAEIHNNEEKNNSLTETHKKALHNYTKESGNINDFLHRNHHDEKMMSGDRSYYSDKVKKIDAAFTNANAHIDKPVAVYTGLPESPHRIIEKEKQRTDSDPEHVLAHLPAYTSTSTKFGIAAGFTRPDENHDFDASGKRLTSGNILKINVPKGHPAISVSHLSRFKDEKEVLLHRGTRLKIAAKPTVIHGYNVWEAEVHSHEPDELRPDPLTQQR